MMGLGGPQEPQATRKRGLQGDQKPPEAKRQAVAADDTRAPRAAGTQERQEAVRAAVRALYAHYNTLCNGSRDAGDPGAFQALLQAAEGDPASQRLAARLLPRFIPLFPGQVDAAAVLLRRLYEAHQDQDAPDKALQEHTRKDALHGLAAVLLAAPPQAPPQSVQAVKRVLSVLLKLLPQAEASSGGSDEPEEEEGEVATCDNPAAHGPWLRRVLRQALQRHPATTLSFCFSCLGAATSKGGGGGSSGVDIGVLQGVRLWLKDHLLREVSPSREGTPLLGGEGSAAAAAAAAAAGGATNGRAAGTGRSCVLQAVLASSQELQLWVMQQARGRASAPPEVRAVLETALQLLPAHQQLAAAKPQLDGRVQKAASVSGAGWDWQQQQQQAAPNGVMPQAPVNGMELSRSWSNPVGNDRRSGQGLQSRHHQQQQQQQQPPTPAACSWGQFPRPGGPICLVEPCLLVAAVPCSASRADVAAELGADEAWLVGEPLPPAAGASAGCSRACCVFKSPLEAAKAYLRHNGQQRFGQQQPPLLLSFTDRLPACSRAAAAAQLSTYVWAARAVAGDAESLSSLAQEANLPISHVHRVNNAKEPGTLLQTPDTKTAADVVAFLLRKHAAAAAAYSRGPGWEESLPPLPQEQPPLPSGEWAATPGGRGGGSRPPPSATPAGAGGPRQQQQQHGMYGSTPQQQQQPGRPPGFRRVNSLPPGMVASGGGPAPGGGPGGWRESPNTPTHRAEWGTPGQPPADPQQQQRQLGRWPSGGQPPLPPQQQQQGGWHAGASPGQHGWQHHGTPPQHMQQQQPPSGGRWPAAGPSPPAGHPNGPHPLGPGGAGNGSPGGGPPPLPPPPGGAAAAGEGPGAPLHGGGRVLWQGSLSKQAIRLCGVLCVEVGGPARASGLAPEPRGWPEQLQVNYRITVTDALSHYQAAQPGARAVRVLVPQDPAAGDEAQLRAFIEYLTSKDRAGMVKLPAAPQAGLGPRSVYLIVPRQHVCQALQVAWDGQCSMLIAVVVPQTGAHHHHQQHGGPPPAAAGGAGAAPGGGGGGGGQLPPPHMQGVQHRGMR